MTYIPTVNYSTKLFLKQELSLANHLNSLSLMPIIILLICSLAPNSLSTNAQQGTLFFFALQWQLLIM